jgi:hypothetical protein
MIDLKCFIGLHHYSVVETMPLCDGRGAIIGKTYVLKCDHCGKIKQVNIITEFNYR